MAIEITLLGKPRTTNKVYKSTCRGSFPSVYMSQEGRDLKESYQWQIKSQYHGKPSSKDVDLAVGLYFGDKRTHDIDNFNKLVLDACSGLIWVDDSQIQSMLITKHYDPKNPRVELCINFN